MIGVQWGPEGRPATRRVSLLDGKTMRSERPRCPRCVPWDVVRGVARRVACGVTSGLPRPRRWACRCLACDRRPPGVRVGASAGLAWWADRRPQTKRAGHLLPQVPARPLRVAVGAATIVRSPRKHTEHQATVAPSGGCWDPSYSQAAFRVRGCPDVSAVIETRHERCMYTPTVDTTYWGHPLANPTATCRQVIAGYIGSLSVTPRHCGARDESELQYGPRRQ